VVDGGDLQAVEVGRSGDAGPAFQFIGESVFKGIEKKFADGRTTRAIAD
jgi:hypothetical protein